jgi:alpha 1,3-mannosyltransferase
VLRQLNCKLPIQLFYNGDDDLGEENRQLLEWEGVEVIDVSILLDPLKPNSLQGWAIKPFVMLMSSFSEFIFIDADTLFFQNPEVMFEFKSYNETGTLYYRDRTIDVPINPTQNFFRKRYSSIDSPSLAKDFFKSMVDLPSTFVRQQRIWLDISLYEGESGVILMDKKRGGMFVLLLASLMNMDPIKSEMYKVVHGDKESFWMASEALEVPYNWGVGAGGAVGYPNPNTIGSICGGLYHVDENWEPLWFNGGIQMNKQTESGRKKTYNLTHYAIDRSFQHLEW